MAWKQEDELYALDHKKECMGNFIVTTGKSGIAVRHSGAVGRRTA
jgi:hypothetical protein